MPDLEERVRTTLRDVADGIAPSEALDEAVRKYLDTQPRRTWRRSRWRVALAGAVAVVAIAITTVAIRQTRTSGPATQPGVAAPERIVAVRGDGRVVLLSSGSGKTLQNLADGADANTTLAVTADGKQVYFDRPAPNGACEQREIFRVSTGGGPVVPIAENSTAPALSPDGKLLAFVSFQGPGGCRQPGSLVVKDLDTSFLRGWTVAGASESLAAPGWTADSRHLVITLTGAPGSGLGWPRIVDTDASTQPLEQAPLVPNWGGGIFGFLGRTGDLLGVQIVNGPAGQPLRVVAVDPGTGTVRRRLFTLRTRFGDQRLTSDLSGRHVLASAPSGSRLYRWSEGDKQPTTIAVDAVSAAWVPDRASTAESTTLRDVTKLGPNAARKKLESEGLNVTVEYRTDRVSPGGILEQRPAPGTRVSPGDRVVLVIDAFLPCGGFFRPTAVPEGFDAQSRPGPAPEAAAANVPSEGFSLHYTDGHGRSIEIRRPATPRAEGAADEVQVGDAYVLGQAVTIQPLPPGRDEPLIARFFFPADEPSDPCGSYSINGYGVTKRAMRVFAESLVPVP